MAWPGVALRGKAFKDDNLLRRLSSLLYGIDYVARHGKARLDLAWLG